MKGILGKKIGMTQVFTKEGKLIPVTVIEVEPNVVTQIKTVEKDGYEAVQLATDTIRESLSNKPAMGHTNKANTINVTSLNIKHSKKQSSRIEELEKEIATLKHSLTNQTQMNLTLQKESMKLLEEIEKYKELYTIVKNSRDILQRQ